MARVGRALQATVALCVALFAGTRSVSPATEMPAPVPALGLHVAPCTQGRSHRPALCGTFGVYENRATRAGRVIALHVIVLKAAAPRGRAIAMIGGGPGQAATGFAAPIADGAFGREALDVAVHDGYDVVFMDVRGMGDSHAFGCDLAPAAHPERYFKQLWPDAILSACRTKSVATHDLAQYNTNAGVDDLDDLRAALGYPALVLDGGSYGTFFALVFARRHPRALESAVLNGVTAPHFQTLPGAPQGAQTAMDDLFVKCRRDRVCRTHFPAFPRHFALLLRRFDRGPVMVPVKNAVTKRIQTVALSKEVFIDRLRQTTYDPLNAASIPFVVERAYRGDLAPLGDMIDGITQAFAHALDQGALLSFTCADEIPFITDAEIRAAAAHSYAGDLRIRAQQRACAIWNVPPMPPEFNDLIRSNAPMLLITGTDDPATPPRSAAQQLPYLPNAKQMLLRGAGHATENACTARTIAAFVRARSARGLDVNRCSTSVVQPPFDTH